MTADHVPQDEVSSRNLNSMSDSAIYPSFENANHGESYSDVVSEVHRGESHSRHPSVKAKGNGPGSSDR